MYSGQKKRGLSASFKFLYSVFQFFDNPVNSLLSVEKFFRIFMAVFVFDKSVQIFNNVYGIGLHAVLSRASLDMSFTPSFSSSV